MTTQRPVFPSDKLDKFLLRMPHGMRERIARKAEENRRSMTAEIVARLEFTLTQEGESELAYGWEQDLAEAVNDVGVEEAPTEYAYREATSDPEAYVLSWFRRLPVWKQHALLVLLIRE